jgi:acyl carrier protein
VDDAPRDRLLAFVRRRLVKNGRRVNADTPLFSSRLIDSMNILYLIGYLEKSLGRRLTDHELVMSNFRTVDAIASCFFDD